MNFPADGRENIEDWYFLENLKRQNGNNTDPLGGQSRQTDHDNTPRKRTKDFIENELRAMSTLSLYDDSLDKMKSPDADK
jgi:hypothetical protein